MGKSFLAEEFGKREYKNHVKQDSLDRFVRRFGKTLGQAHLLCTKDVRTDGDMPYLPLYMASILRPLVRSSSFHSLLSYSLTEVTRAYRNESKQ